MEARSCPKFVNELSALVFDDLTIIFKDCSNFEFRLNPPRFRRNEIDNTLIGQSY